MAIAVTPEMKVVLMEIQTHMGRVAPVEVMEEEMVQAMAPVADQVQVPEKNSVLA